MPLERVINSAFFSVQFLNQIFLYTSQTRLSSNFLLQRPNTYANKNLQLPPRALFPKKVCLFQIDHSKNRSPLARHGPPDFDKNLPNVDFQQTLLYVTQPDSALQSD